MYAIIIAVLKKANLREANNRFELSTEESTEEFSTLKTLLLTTLPTVSEVVWDVTGLFQLHLLNHRGELFYFLQIFIERALQCDISFAFIALDNNIRRPESKTVVTTHKPPPPPPPYICIFFSRFQQQKLEIREGIFQVACEMEFSILVVWSLNPALDWT